MKFNEIFTKDGDYVASSFQKGTCIRITDGCMMLVTYKNKDEKV